MYKNSFLIFTLNVELLSFKSWSSIFLLTDLSLFEVIFFPILCWILLVGTALVFQLLRLIRQRDLCVYMLSVFDCCLSWSHQWWLVFVHSNWLMHFRKCRAGLWNCLWQIDHLLGWRTCTNCNILFTMGYWTPKMMGLQFFISPESFPSLGNSTMWGVHNPTWILELFKACIQISDPIKIKHHFQINRKWTFYQAHIK